MNCLFLDTFSYKTLPLCVFIMFVCLYVCARFYIFWGSENRCLCYGFAAELYWLECYTWQEREEESIQHIHWNFVRVREKI